MISNQCELTFHVPSPKTGIVNPLFSFTFGTLTILHDSRDWLNSSRWHLSSLMNFTQATNEVCVSHDEFLFHDSANTVQPALVREYKQFSQTTTNSNRSHETATREKKIQTQNWIEKRAAIDNRTLTLVDADVAFSKKRTSRLLLLPPPPPDRRCRSGNKLVVKMPSLVRSPFFFLSAIF